MKVDRNSVASSIRVEGESVVEASNHDFTSASFNGRSRSSKFQLTINNLTIGQEAGGISKGKVLNRVDTNGEFHELVATSLRIARSW